MAHVKITEEGIDAPRTMIEGACHPDGTWRNGWHPKGPGSWFVKNTAPGEYDIFHSLGTNDYSVSSNIVKDTGVIQVTEASDKKMHVSIAKDGIPTNLGFWFVLSVRM